MVPLIFSLLCVSQKHFFYHYRNIFASLCQKFCPQGGVCLSACWDTPPPGRHTPGQTSPGKTPQGRHFLGRHPHGQTPPCADNPSGQTPPGQTPPMGRHPSPRVDTPLPSATAVDGTHPTVMLSCFP